MKPFGLLFGIKEYKYYLCNKFKYVTMLLNYMEREKKIGMVLAGEAPREVLEKEAYEKLKMSWLAMLRKAIRNGYKENGSEGEVRVRMTVTYQM